MAREAFIARDFRGSSDRIIEQANEIIVSYQAQGFTLTLRQLYYQFVARDLLPNKQSEYKRLGSIINDARLAGRIDWDAIEDRTRNVRTHASWESPEDMIAAAAAGYQEDLWSGQKWWPEVWIEKDALLGVIEPACNRFRVPFFACRGYTSQSEQYGAGKRFEHARRRGRKPIVLHLGDHDPSGIDMTRDNNDRLAMFARRGVQVQRLALNYAQVEQYDPPPNPAKETDSRAPGYIKRFGGSSWELDALDPAVIDALITAAIEKLIDRKRWDEATTAESERREVLERASRRWGDVEDFLSQEQP